MIAIVLSALVGCDEREAASERTETTTERSPAPAPAPTEAPAQSPTPAAIALSEIGYAAPMPTTSAAAHEANRRALALHRREDFVGSEAGFRAAVEASPTYLLARFNHACALARLGRTDEARAIIERLLAEDYPSFAPRLDDDPDLAPLRDPPHASALRERRARIEAAYRRALTEGMIVTRVHAEPSTRRDGPRVARRAAQVGVWLADVGRFVPMGPSVTRAANDEHPHLMVLATTALDREHGVVMSMSGLGVWSEGGNYISETRVRVDRAITGEALGQLRDPCTVEPRRHCVEPSLHAVEDGAVLAFRDETRAYDAPPLSRRLAGRGRYDAARRPRLRCLQEECTVSYASAPSLDVEVPRPRRAVITFADGARVEVALDAKHACLRAAEVRCVGVAVPDGDGAWLATFENISYDWVPGVGASAISRVTRDGTATVALSGRGPVAIERAPDGAFYLQIGARVERHLPGAIEGEALPEGLLVEPGPDHTFSPEVVDTIL